MNCISSLTKNIKKKVFCFVKKLSILLKKYLLTQKYSKMLISVCLTSNNFKCKTLFNILKYNNF